jgi:hypothetical protein
MVHFILMWVMKVVPICVKRFHVTGTHMAVWNFEIVSDNITYLKPIRKRLIHINVLVRGASNRLFALVVSEALERKCVE